MDKLYPELKSLCKRLSEEFYRIPQERKSSLSALTAYLAGKNGLGSVPEVIFICTHNSRRSHMAQLWMAAGADYYQLPEIKVYSGGTESTAFNSHAVNALKESGFMILTKEHSINPTYKVSWKKDMNPIDCFSKRFDKIPGLTENFAAVMVCNEADEACPFVPGADFRLSLPFIDPKASDGSGKEKYVYHQKSLDIGRELLYCLSQVKDILDR